MLSTVGGYLAWLICFIVSMHPGVCCFPFMGCIWGVKDFGYSLFTGKHKGHVSNYN